MMTPLKPCPFCGSGVKRLIELWDVLDIGHVSRVHCEGCGANGPGAYSDISAHDAIMLSRAKWDVRADI